MKNYLNTRDENGDIKTPVNYSRKTVVGKWLECGCCGSGFQMWRGYVDQCQDNGYGICKDCQGWIEEKDGEQMDDIIKLVSDALNDDNKKQFLGFERSKQEGICLKMMDKGLLTFKIGGN